MPGSSMFGGMMGNMEMPDVGGLADMAGDFGGGDDGDSGGS